eukprot:53232_1
MCILYTYSDPCKFNFKYKLINNNITYNYVNKNVIFSEDLMEYKEIEHWQHEFDSFFFSFHFWMLFYFFYYYFYYQMLIFFLFFSNDENEQQFVHEHLQILLYQIHSFYSY